MRAPGYAKIQASDDEDPGGQRSVSGARSEDTKSWRGATPPRPPPGDSAALRRSRAAVDAAVAGAACRQVHERRATPGVRQRTVGVRAAGRFAGRLHAVRPVWAARGGGWPPPGSRTAGVESWNYALCTERRGDRGCHRRGHLLDERGRARTALRRCRERGQALMMAGRWTESEDTAVRLAAALDYEDGGQRLRELADRLDRTEAAVRQRASRLRAAQLEGNVV